MRLEEALETCDEWFAYLKRQQERSKKMQELAKLARTDAPAAQAALRKLDTASVTVYDGARLEPAVRALVLYARRSL